MSNNFTKKSSDLDDLGDLTNDELPRLSKIIKYEEDIKPYRYIQIFSGVGSGKNTLINRFVSGDPEYGIPKKTVLVITSRRSKVDEQLSDEEVSFATKIGKWGNMGKEIYDDDDKDIKRFKSNIRIIKDEYGEHTIYQESVICTNAFIEKYLQKVYNPEDAGTHLWNLFDMIVIDEFHSLVLDATYQTAPYHVNSLIWEFAHRCQMADMNPDSVEPPLCQHLILMTGTPETVKSLPVPYLVPHVLDKMDTCVNVVPKNIWFLDQKQARDMMDQLWTQKRRFIYFANHVIFPEKFCKGTNIDPNTVALSFSADDRRKTLLKSAQAVEKAHAQKKTDANPSEEKDYSEADGKNAQIYSDMLKVENSISSTGIIPSNFSVWLTTSRNKEGININSQDINDVFVESHNISDIKQMAGRVRHGAENLYIITDSPGHKDIDYPHEYLLSRDEYAPSVQRIDKGKQSPEFGSCNRHLKKICEQSGYSDFFANRESGLCPTHNDHNVISKMITRFQVTMPYVQFDYFRNHFCLYYLKGVGEHYVRTQNQQFEEAKVNPAAYIKIFTKAFPVSIVHPYKDRNEQMSEYLDQLLSTDPNQSFSTEEVNAHFDALNRIKFDDPNTYYSNRNSLFKVLGYKVDRVGNDPKKPCYNRWRYKKIEPKTSAS